MARAAKAPAVRYHLLLTLIAAHLLLRIPAHLIPWTHFWIKTGWDIVGALLRCAILLDMMALFPGLQLHRAKARIYAAEFASVVIAVSAWFCWQTGSVYVGQPLFRLMNAVTLMDRALCLAGVSFMVLALTALKPFGWSRRGALIGHGMFWLLGASMLTSIMVSFVRTPTYFMGQMIAASIALTSQAILCASMFVPEEVFDVPEDLIPTLQSLCELPVEKVG